MLISNEQLEVAQIVEQSSPTPDVPSLNPVSNIIEQFSTIVIQMKMKLKEKDAGNAAYKAIRRL